MSFKNQLSVYFSKLEKEIKGVERAFIFPRNALNSEDDLQENLKYLVSVLSERCVPKKFLIQTHKKSMEIYITEHFLLGAVSNSDANPHLITVMLTRITSHIEEYFENFKATRIETIEENIYKKISDLMPNHDRPMKTDTLTLFSNDLKVEGEIKLVVRSQIRQDTLKKKIQEILNEEIPFFCKKHVNIEFKTEYLGLDRVNGITKQQLSKVIQRIQEM